MRESDEYRSGTGKKFVKGDRIRVKGVRGTFLFEKYVEKDDEQSWVECRDEHSWVFRAFRAERCSKIRGPNKRTAP